MTFAEKFNSLKSAFEKANTKKFNADFAVQITMTDEDCGGTFYIEYKNGNYSVEPYDYYDNNAYVNASAASVAKLAKGTVAKDVEIGGDEEVVKTLAASLKPAKKPAAKKAPAKKAPAKKAPAAKKETVKKEFGPLTRIRDNYFKMVLSMDGETIVNKGGIINFPFISFLVGG